MAYFGLAAIFSKHGLPRPRSNPEAARLQRQGPLSARSEGRCGTENYEPLSSLPVSVRVIGRFHHQQAKEPAKWVTRHRLCPLGPPARPAAASPGVRQLRPAGLSFAPTTLGRSSRSPLCRGSGPADHWPVGPQNVCRRRGLEQRHNPGHRRIHPGRTGR
jgi:hypothetical protein